MKKIVSILLTMTMLLAATSVFADSQRPAAISPETYSAKVVGANTKVSLDGATATFSGQRNTAFGTGDALIDGIGMIGSYISNDSAQEIITEGMAAGTAIPDHKTRWTSKTAGESGHSFTITFTDDKTFNELKWTEARRVIGGVTIEFYNDDEKIGTKTGSFTDVATNDDNKVYLRTVNFGESITADKVVIRVDSLLRTDKVFSIAEIELWNSSVSSITNDETAAPTWSSFGPVTSIFDGVGMVGTHIDNDSTKDIITDGKGAGTAIPTASNRWMTYTKGAAPTFTITFSADKTFNELRWTETRKVIKTVDIECYKDDAKVATKTFSFTDESKTNSVYLRTANFGDCVTADKVVFNVTATAYTDTYVSVAEMEFWNTPSTPTITDATGAALTPLSREYSFDKVFDGSNLPEVTNDRFISVIYDKDNDGALLYEVPITIAYDLGSVKTFNYAELRERRCLFGSIDVYVSSDGTGYNKVATMPNIGYSGATSREYIHNVSFDTVNARYVRFVINEIAKWEELPDQGTSYGATITEISLYNYPTVSDEVVVYPMQTFSTDISESTESFNNVNTHITLNNTSDSAKLYRVYGAAYTTEGSLDAVGYVDVTVEANKQRTINVFGFAKETSNKLNIMVWDEDMTPYIEAVKLEKTVTE